jgi:hypothetical protein
MDVRIGALTAGMVIYKVHVGEPQAAQTAHPDACVMQPGDDHCVASRCQHSRLKEGLDDFVR